MPQALFCAVAFACCLGVFGEAEPFFAVDAVVYREADQTLPSGKRRPYTLPFLGPAELDVHEGRYVYLVAANPPRYVRLELDFSTDVSVLYTTSTLVPSFRPGTKVVDESLTGSGPSRTLAQPVALAGHGNISGETASEIFYFGPYKLRIPVIIRSETSPRIDALLRTENEIEPLTSSTSDFTTIADTLYSRPHTSSAPEVDGKLALGPGSALWRYWHNATLSVTTFLLGGRDEYATEWSHACSFSLCNRYCSPFSRRGTFTVTEGATVVIESPDQTITMQPTIVFDPARHESYIPQKWIDGATTLTATATMDTRECAVPFPSTDDDDDDMGTRYSSPSEDTAILGLGALRQSIVFIDWLEGTFTVAPVHGQTHLRRVHVEWIVLYIFLTCIMLLTWSWFTYARGIENLTDSYSVRILVVGEWAAAALAGLALCCFDVLQPTPALLRHLLRTDDVSAVYRVTLLAMLVLLNVAVLVPNSAAWYRMSLLGPCPAVLRQRARTNTVRQIVLSSSLLLAAWLALLPRHQTVHQIGYLLILAISGTMHASFCTFDVWMKARRESSVVGHVVCTLLFVGWYAFLYTANVLPAIHAVWGPGHPNRFALAGLFVALVVLGPSVYLYSVYQKKLLTRERPHYDLLSPFDSVE